MPHAKEIRKKRTVGIFARKIFQNLEKVFSIEDDATLDEKLIKFYEVFSISSEDLNVRKELKECIQSLLRPYYPDCQVVTVGSSTNGFGVVRCYHDMIFLPNVNFNSKLPTTIKTVPWKPLGKKSLMEGIEIDQEPLPNPADVLSGTFPSSKLLELKEEIQLLFISKVMQQHKDKFKLKYVNEYENKLKIQARNSNLQTIPFFHIDSKTSCLLSLKNRLAIHNSELLELYGMLDKRVKPLMFAICFWTKCLNIIKPLVFTTFCVQLMVVFFLQNTTPALLPAVSYLHKLKRSSQLINGWEVSIEKDIKKIPKTRNAQTLGELFRQFFQFYWNFDFSQNIVSIHTGRSYPIKDLRNNPSFSEFQVTPICVQDPFQLKYNVSLNIDSFHYSRFKQMVCITLSTLNSNPKMPLDGFKKLFTMDTYKHNVSYQIQNTFQREHYTCVLYPTWPIIQSLGGSQVAREMWFDRAPMAVFELLKYGLLIDCEITNKLTFLQKRTSLKKDASLTYVKESDENSLPCDEVIPLEQLLEIQCIVDHHCWMQRDVSPTTTYPEAEDFSNTLIKREYEISRFLVEQNPKRFKLQPKLLLTTQLFASKLGQLMEIFVVLVPLTECKEFDSFCKFLSKYLPMNIPQLLV